MNKKNITIRKILSLGAIVTTFILIFIGFFITFFINNTSKEYQLISTLKSIENKELQIRKFENDLLVFETVNPDFYRTGQSNFLSEIEQNMDFITLKINDLEINSTIERMGFQKDLKEVNTLFNQYSLQINKLMALIITKGFQDFGYVGKMRDQIHTVESEIKKVNNDRFAVDMLMLRRHEKDYLLRRNLKYKEKFDKTMEEFIAEINMNNTDYAYLIPILNKYEQIFENVIKIDQKIGTNNSSGIRYNMNQTISEIETKLANISNSIEKASNKKINRTSIYLFSLILVFSVIIIVILFQTSRYIVRSIDSLRHYITRLGHGELPEDIPIYNNDEIAHMKVSINQLTKNLKNTKNFAEAVGNGNFDVEVDVFGNQGDLGSVLVDMRKKLIQVSNEREQQIQESKERLWANDGYNKIHDILSSGTKNNEELYYMIISKLTKFLNANQASLFLSDDESNGSVLSEAATFAFDRRKVNEKKIKIGEGIMGAVAFEKQTTYITDIPENYINITSGLGDASPRSLLIVPCMSENELMGIIEIASFKEFEPYQIKFVEKVAGDIANNLRKIKIERTTRQLLDKTQKQTAELIEKEEEMNQNFEELQATQEALELREKELTEEINKLKMKK